MKQKLDIFLATGGTGGHIFPAQSVAECLIYYRHNIMISYDKRCLHLISESLQSLPCLLLENSSNDKTFRSLLKNCFYTILNCYRVIRLFLSRRPKIVIAFGSYATFPPLFAAVLLRIPFFLHEQNTTLGSVNKLFLPFAQKIFLSFPLKDPVNVPFILTGLPIRKDVLASASKKNTRDFAKDGKLHLTVIGGSQGAKVLCQVVSEAINLLPIIVQKKILLEMQIRKELLSELLLALDKTKCTYELNNFIDDIGRSYKNADIIITRAGASSIAEIMSVGQSAIIVPLPSSKANHQYLNALDTAKAGNNLMMREQKIFSALWLKDRLLSLIEEKNTTGGSNIKVCRSLHLDAAESIVEITRNYARLRYL